MNKLISLLLLFILFNCKAEKDENDTMLKFYPENFIKPRTIVNGDLNPKTNSILENLSEYNTNEFYAECYNDKIEICPGKKNVNTKIFINYTKDKKELSFLYTIEAKCQCETIFKRMIRIETIPIEQIYRIDTLAGLKGSYGNGSLTNIFIYPKYNADVISYKEIRGGYIPLYKSFRYEKDSGNTKNPIGILAKWQVAKQLKINLDNLIKENN